MAKGRPATTPEAIEKNLVNLAMKEAEKRILNGTATSQELTHFLKLGTEKARLEKEKAELELDLIRAKTEAIKSGQAVEELMKEALAAFKEYSGGGSDEEDV